MIYSLEGTIVRLLPPEITVDVNGVGYLVHVPLPVFDELKDGTVRKLLTYTHVREDRLDLFGFLTAEDRKLFMAVIELPGIGPKLGLEICSVSKRIIHQAIATSDATLLSEVKGVGKKRAEKLLLDLKTLFERDPAIATDRGETRAKPVDDDALLALVSLGYERNIIQHALNSLPTDIEKTEDRVTAVLRSL